MLISTILYLQIRSFKNYYLIINQFLTVNNNIKKRDILYFNKTKHVDIMISLPSKNKSLCVMEGKNCSTNVLFDLPVHTGVPKNSKQIQVFYYITNVLFDPPEYSGVPKISINNLTSCYKSKSET